MLDNILIPVLERDDVVMDDKAVAEGLTLQKYLPFPLVEWEIFLFAVIAGLRYPNGDPYYSEIRILIGRGSGKNGFIDFLILYFLSPYHGIHEYNIDLLANSEVQVKTSFKDVYNLIKNPVKPEYAKVLKQNFSVTLESIVGKVTNSELRFNTSSKHGKDSKRTGCIIYDEKHEFQDRDIMNTLESGLGKIPRPRIITITTDGHVREGVLDKEKAENEEILKEYDPDNDIFVFWCRLEEEEEWKDPENMVKANPSFHEPCFREIRKRIVKEIRKMPETPDYYAEFMAKRCNYPIGNMETAVATVQDIKATDQELPDLTGRTCIGAVDYANTNDFVACVLLFKVDRKICVLHHTFICKYSRDLLGIKAPLEEWAKRGDCEFVDAPQVGPEIVAGWFAQMAETYNIIKLAIDRYRYTLLMAALRNVGFDAKDGKTGNIYLTRKWDNIMVAPVLNSLFVTRSLIYGDVPMLRWYTNNTKKVLKNGNTTFEKIEEHYRKTDGFMAIVTGLSLYEDLPDDTEVFADFEVYSY